MGGEHGLDLDAFGWELTNLFEQSLRELMVDADDESAAS